MRPGQQNKRGRGRGGSNNGGGGNNFNRKGGNPLTRTYDSSGPDVKIRGTAQHIAEKYAALARDAQSSGDRVIAENYLQHAEHYNRIIAAAQAQMQERFQRDDRGEFQDRDGQEGDDIETTEGDDEGSFRQQPSAEAQPQRRDNQQQREQQRERQNRRERDQLPAAEAAPAIDGSGPQPVIEGIPAEVAAESEEQGAQAERQPRRRNAGNRPRRPRRGEEGAAQEDGAAEPRPELADAAGE
ncbi:hypothetical protein REJC140_03318 [Pseudorhizobium endolithicum]|uniref:DUF4167 domain-containing protein n=1 Tax=Pseudorhizobium endolithicum TaxID=1191678 RepID=A0ABM8PK73_9HYPH|nr:DUF4167 domain-containing protein [Pseudorhizobium endolithicum]CAD6432910.1 hypothetical protein REQ54_03774 [Rhizobium sp. Q54]CAD7034458.1 hypothetical protein REJC140_03318 [Pseudorhizobium endolithicum]